METESAPPPPSASQLRRADLTSRRRIVRKLRERGYSYGEIATSVPTPKSTIATWCRDIRLTREQRNAIEARRGSTSRQGISVDTQWRRRVEVQRTRGAAARYANEARSDPLFVAGVCLYWAEGSKTRNDLSITNSDPRLLRIFVDFVRAHLDATARFGLALNLHDAAGEDRAKEHWAHALELPSVLFTKSYVKQPGTGHGRNRLPHGVCRVRVRRASDHWHRVTTWIDVVAQSATS